MNDLTHLELLSRGVGLECREIMDTYRRAGYRYQLYKGSTAYNDEAMTYQQTIEFIDSIRDGTFKRPEPVSKQKPKTRAEPSTAQRVAAIEAAAGARGLVARCFTYYFRYAVDLKDKNGAVIRENLSLEAAEAFLGIK